jgi:hypothetical protein
MVGRNDGATERRSEGTKKDLTKEGFNEGGI